MDFTTSTHIPALWKRGCSSHCFKSTNCNARSATNGTSYGWLKDHNFVSHPGPELLYKLFLDPVAHYLVKKPLKVCIKFGTLLVDIGLCLGKRTSLTVSKRRLYFSSWLFVCCSSMRTSCLGLAHEISPMLNSLQIQCVGSWAKFPLPIGRKYICCRSSALRLESVLADALRAQSDVNWLNASLTFTSYFPSGTSCMTALFSKIGSN